MPGPLPYEHRIVTIGNSMALGLGPTVRGGIGVGPPYPVRLEQALRASGVPARSIASGRSGQLLGKAIERLEPDVIHQSPSVVLVQLGGYEVFSGALPEVVRRYLYPDFPNQSAPSRLLRRITIRPMRRVANRLQRVHGRILGVRGGRRSPARFERELVLLLDTVRRLAGDPFVVLLSIASYDAAVAEAMPGLVERTAVLNEVLRRQAEQRGERVAYVDLDRELAGVEWLSADGFHLNEAGHAAVAELLLPVVRPHLVGP